MTTDGVYDQTFEVHQRRIELDALRMTEGFALGVSQTVSAAALFGIVSQFESLAKPLGPNAPRLGLTFFALSLSLALVASLFRFFARLWDVKSGLRERDREVALARMFSSLSRWSLSLSVAIAVIALLSAIVALWLVTFGLIAA